MNHKVIIDRIEDKKIQLDKKRPFPPATLRSLREKMILDWTYHSNAIEGNTLTLKETKVVLEGITVGGKTLREHLEAINHKEAIEYIEEVIQKQEPLNEWQIKTIHSIVLKGILPEEAGRYRQENVTISGAVHIPPDYTQVQSQMQDMLTWYNAEGQACHPVERAAILHSLLVKIHPFVDGNGRTARLLLNLELMKTGYLPIVIKKESRLEYYEALDHSHVSGDYEPFFLLTSQLLEEMFDFYLEIIK